MNKFLKGFFTGVIICSILIKIFDEPSPYDWILDVLDKPFINTHGICILAGLGSGILIYYIAQGILNNYYKQTQNMIQNDTDKFDKIIKNLFKIIKRK